MFPAWSWLREDSVQSPPQDPSKDLSLNYPYPLFLDTAYTTGIYSLIPQSLCTSIYSPLLMALRICSRCILCSLLFYTKRLPTTETNGCSQKVLGWCRDERLEELLQSSGAVYLWQSGEESPGLSNIRIAWGLAGFQGGSSTYWQLDYCCFQPGRNATV
ncbi:hypothetical protein FGO68_gene5923 [Halteria grandinella]|uniref:Uncharacterized protein n=1 Tax=Halteria grandinella TaxID=5974 RepID=A0A8J8NFL1_HALGN|nr:hypothetical protein FGO68_gene5923 [Halteria grandinella]